MISREILDKNTHALGSFSVSGCSISVVRTLRVREGRVQFSAPRHCRGLACWEYAAGFLGKNREDKVQFSVPRQENRHILRAL